MSATAEILDIYLQDTLAGYLVNNEGGRNVLIFDERFIHNEQRPTLTLNLSKQSDATAIQSMLEPWVHRQRLDPLLSNLLPEGALREWTTKQLKIHEHNEFPLLAYLGQDLPGAIRVQASNLNQLPTAVMNQLGGAEPKAPDLTKRQQGFSLAGVQMKFSMKARDGRFNYSSNSEHGDWIVKTPSTVHPFVPQNEFSAMQLAKAIGVEIPDIQLIPLASIDNLPAINLPDEAYAYAIKRFDRDGEKRIHMEDFAQILSVYPNQKYDKGNYQQLAKLTIDFSGNALADLEQWVRRLVANILLANGDAHLKNWSLIYPDGFHPRLSPAYDILTTAIYMNDETDFALNLARNKNWYKTDASLFDAWANKIGANRSFVQKIVKQTIDTARSTFPSLLKDLPITEQHAIFLHKHWGKLHADLKI